MKDAGLKELLYRHFRAQGWYALVEVPVFNIAGLSGAKYLITDIDVLGVRPSVDLRWEIVIGDCKTKKGESPANRSLWVRSVMEQFEAARGIVLLRRDNKAIEPDHRLLAQANRVALLDEKDFDAYDRAMLYPAGSSTFHESVATLATIRVETAERFPKLVPLAAFINAGAWNERDHYLVLRGSLGAGGDARQELDPARNDHLALILEAAGVFAVALATCVGEVFHQYLQPNDRVALDGALRVLIWGGRARYDQIARLWKELADARNLPEDRRNTPPFPDWNRFLELVRNLLDAPHLAFQIPQLLRSAALATCEGGNWSGANLDPMLLKLGMMTAVYYSNACRFPPETKSRLQAIFLAAMTGALGSAKVSATDASEPAGESASVQPRQVALPLSHGKSG